MGGLDDSEGVMWPSRTCREHSTTVRSRSPTRRHPPYFHFHSTTALLRLQSDKTKRNTVPTSTRIRLGRLLTSHSLPSLWRITGNGPSTARSARKRTQSSAAATKPLHIARAGHTTEGARTGSRASGCLVCASERCVQKQASELRSVVYAGPAEVCPGLIVF